MKMKYSWILLAITAIARLKVRLPKVFSVSVMIVSGEYVQTVVQNVHGLPLQEWTFLNSTL
jgi:hypothetical protein